MDGVCVYASYVSVSSLSEAGCEPAACDAAEEEEVQEPHPAGLQDAGHGRHQHGRGTSQHAVTTGRIKIKSALL